MKYTVIEKDYEYIPEWDGNADRDETEQIRCTLRYLTDAERTKCERTWYDEDGNAHYVPHYENLIKFGVVSIENLEVNGVEIKTGRDLAKLKGFYPLFLEIGQEVVIRNMRLEPKNS